MRVSTCRLAASLLIAFAAVPVQGALSEPTTDDAGQGASRCDGVIIDGEWTGHCGNGCYGEIHVNGNWFASYTC